nr:MAG TPA: hypothetical protein [Caudoviricetes sp.]DAK00375.1 MAG TPA: hypothetical protein [Caudoviricetes sp.]
MFTAYFICKAVEKLSFLLFLCLQQLKAVTKLRFNNF